MPERTLADSQRERARCIVVLALADEELMRGTEEALREQGIPLNPEWQAKIEQIWEAKRQWEQAYPDLAEVMHNVPALLELCRRVEQIVGSLEIPPFVWTSDSTGRTDEED